MKRFYNTSYTKLVRVLTFVPTFYEQGSIAGGAVYSAHTSYRLDSAPTSISSFYRRYFLNCLSMSLHLFDAVFRFIRTGCHLIMEGVYVTIWTEQMDWSSRWLPRSHDLFPVVFFSWVPRRALCMTQPSILKLIKWHEYPSALLRSMKRPVFSNKSANPCRIGIVRAYMTMVEIQNTSCQASIYHTFYLLFV